MGEDAKTNTVVSMFKRNEKVSWVQIVELTQ